MKNKPIIIVQLFATTILALVLLVSCASWKGNSIERVSMNYLKKYGKLSNNIDTCFTLKHSLLGCYNDGKLEKIGNIHNGKKQGNWMFYDSNQNLTAVCYYIDDSCNIVQLNNTDW